MCAEAAVRFEKPDASPGRTIQVGAHEEGFLICRDGEAVTVFSGESRVLDPRTDKGMLVAKRGAVQGVAGVGNIPLDGGRALGGWISFLCDPLSLRRFVLRYTEDLIQGKPVRDILCEHMRQYLRTAFAAANKDADSRSLRRRVQEEIRSGAADALLCIGWQLKEIRLEHFQITEEGYNGTGKPAGSGGHPGQPGR